MSGAAVALQAAGSLVKGAAGFQAGKANARAARAEAASAIRAGVAEEADIRARARRVAGEALAAQGANGGGLGTGSALELLRETVLESELDRMRVRRAAANRAAGLNAQARLARRQGAFDLIGGIVGAGGAIAGSGGTGG